MDKDEIIRLVNEKYPLDGLDVDSDEYFVTRTLRMEYGAGIAKGYDYAISYLHMVAMVNPESLVDLVMYHQESEQIDH